MGFTRPVAYLCRVKRGANLTAVRDRDVLLRVAQQRALHTVQHAVSLRAIWRTRGRDQGDLWPLYSAFNGEDVHWVEGTLSTFVRVPRRVGQEQESDDGSLAAHQWVQLKLADLGVLLGDTRVRLEAPSGASRIDVLWGNAGIAWEVDFSVKTRSEQEERELLMSGVGLTLVSVVDAKAQRPQLAHVPRVAVLNLAAMAKKPGALRWSFGEAYVGNAMRLDVGAVAWTQWRSLSVEAFCRELVQGHLKYGDVGAKGGWVTVADAALYERLQRERAQAAKLAAEARSAQREKERAAGREKERADKREKFAEWRAVCGALVEAVRAGEVRAPTDQQRLALGDEGLMALEQLHQLVQTYNRSWLRFFGGGKTLRKSIDERRRAALSTLARRQKELEELIESHAPGSARPSNAALGTVS